MYIVSARVLFDIPALISSDFGASLSLEQLTFWGWRLDRIRVIYSIPNALSCAPTLHCVSVREVR